MSGQDILHTIKWIVIFLTFAEGCYFFYKEEYEKAIFNLLVAIFVRML